MKYQLLMLILLLSVIHGNAEVVNSDSVTVERNSYYHINFEILKSVTLIISGEVDTELSLLMLDDSNYSLWVNQQTFSDILNEEINNTFSFEIDFTIINKIGIHLLFIARETDSSLSYSVEISTRDKGLLTYPIYLPSIMIALILNHLYTRPREKFLS